MANEIKTALQGLVDVLRDGSTLAEYVGTGLDGQAQVYDHYHPAAFLDGTARAAVMVRWTGCAGESQNETCPEKTVLPVQAEVDCFWRGSWDDFAVHSETGEQSALDLVETVLTQMRTAAHWDTVASGESGSVIHSWWISSISAPTDAEIEDESAYRVTIVVTINVVTDKPYIDA